MTAASNEVVAVIQADRDMVQAFHRLRLNKLMEAIKDEKAGARLGEDEGDAGDLVQAFARHRIAHSDPRPVAEGLREALERIERFVSLMMPQVPITTRRNCEADIVRMANDFADLRAALATHSPAPMAGAGQEAVSDAMHVELWKADAEVNRLSTALENAYRGLSSIFSILPFRTSRTLREKVVNTRELVRAALAAHPSTQEGSK